MNIFVNFCYKAYHALFWCRRKYAMLFEEEPVIEERVSVQDLPWLWIGAELDNNIVTTVTDQINDEVQYGDRVNEDYLVDVTRIFNAKRWLYLDSQTLKEEEIPLSGLVIGNDTKLSKSL